MPGLGLTSWSVRTVYAFTPNTVELIPNLGAHPLEAGPSRTRSSHGAHFLVNGIHTGDTPLIGLLVCTIITMHIRFRTVRGIYTGIHSNLIRTPIRS